MRALLITYELRGTGRAQRRTALKQVLSCTPAWWHHIESTWIVLTDETEELSKRLLAQLGDEDCLFLVGIDPNASAHGQLPQEAWDWLKHHLR